MVHIPENLRGLLGRPIVCSLATVMPDGQPQLTPVWFDYDGQHVRINTAKGRQKYRNMTRDARVSILVVDPTDTGHWIEVRGHIVDSIEGQPADDHINALSWRYDGQAFSKPQGQIRIMYRIAIDRINGE
jgi:PPOX class probable F420-dependent enzyme